MIDNALDDARAAIADLDALLGAVDSCSVALRDSLERGESRKARDFSQRLEQTVEAVREAEQFVAAAITRARVDGCVDALASEIAALQARSSHVARFQRDTAWLLESARNLGGAAAL